MLRKQMKRETFDLTQRATKICIIESNLEDTCVVWYFQCNWPWFDSEQWRPNVCQWRRPTSWNGQRWLRMCWLKYVSNWLVQSSCLSMKSLPDDIHKKCGFPRLNPSTSQSEKRIPDDRWASILLEPIRQLIEYRAVDKSSLTIVSIKTSSTARRMYWNNWIENSTPIKKRQCHLFNF